MLYCAIAKPPSADFNNHLLASVSSRGTPLPCANNEPKLNSASTFPCSADARNHRPACSSSCLTPFPLRYALPICSCAVESPDSAREVSVGISLGEARGAVCALTCPKEAATLNKKTATISLMETIYTIRFCYCTRTHGTA